ncbi:flagellar hook-associated protein FlgK [Undibacter mobilis]|uniref:Flagellar hook-associated protein 1 n=1 Tax=Undibacter mobilis TaxID=2292256 RepID=A0A371BC92_9BRAD|nr:flagellar hook-associated protein FlgK [Undibacter mobilis]RDV05180.1 flagellar hook-associated protein FlgK [Undibacter mobilis]
MSLSQALISSIAGLNTTQSNLALVSANVANAGTPGYVRKTANQVATAANGTAVGVRTVSVQRELDSYVQRQLRTENSGASYASIRAQFYNQLQSVYGQPGSATALDTVYNNFTSSLQTLASSPDDASAQAGVVGTARLLAEQLNSMTSQIQSLRNAAELGLSDSVSQANDAMQHIASINSQLSGVGTIDSSAALLLDQRDAYIDKLSKLMDINVVPGDRNQVTVFTNSGVQLVSRTASTLGFDATGSVSANTTWNADPDKRGVGTLTLTSANGSTVDLIQTNAIRSGEIAGYLQMRDQDLVQAQTQLDAFAAVMSSALSNTTTQGTAVTSGAQSGFDVDISGLSAGNTITINYTDGLTHTPRTLTLMRVDDPKALPLPNDATANPNDRVVGIDFSGGMSTVFGQIASAISSTGMVASNPSGSTLRILNDGPGNIVTVNGVSTTKTATSLTGGGSQMPFFTDGSSVYSGAIDGRGSQLTGLAGRISVNVGLIASPSALVKYTSGVASGDSTRPDFLYKQLSSSTQLFPSGTGIGTTAAPFSGSMSTYLRQVISVQGQNADAAANLKQGQDVVQNALRQRFDDASSVNIDQEMANLLTLQNAYSANARVLSAVKDMLDTLMKL